MNYPVQEKAKSNNKELAERLDVLNNSHFKLVRRYLLGKLKDQRKHKSMLDKLVDKNTLQEIEASEKILKDTLEEYHMAYQLRFEVYYHRVIKELTIS